MIGNRNIILETDNLSCDKFATIKREIILKIDSEPIAVKQSIILGKTNDTK